MRLRVYLGLLVGTVLALPAGPANAATESRNNRDVTVHATAGIETIVGSSRRDGIFGGDGFDWLISGSRSARDA
jgi:hypothetical protein